MLWKKRETQKITNFTKLAASQNIIKVIKDNLSFKYLLFKLRLKNDLMAKQFQGETIRKNEIYFKFFY